MQTTSIYIELVIIGAEVCTWVFTIFALVDNRVVSVLKNGLSSIPIAIALLGLCYVVGIVFDRIADWIFKKPKEKIRNKMEIPKDKPISQVFLPQNQSYLEAHLPRKRIVRATALNVLPISSALAIYLIIHHISVAIAVAIIVCGIVFFALCLITYSKIMSSHYEKAKENMANEKAKNPAPTDDANQPANLSEKGQPPD